MLQDKPFIYLYDMPKSIVTSVKIAEIIKKACGDYDLTDPVQFKEPRISPTSGLPSPLIAGIIKVDQDKHAQVAKAIKYFEISDGQDKVWSCRSLPFDKDLIGGNKNIINLKQNVFLNKIPADWTSKIVEEKFSAIGPVKSAKVSLSPKIVSEVVDGKKMFRIDDSVPCVSNGYGFVCFENEEDAKKLIGLGTFEAVQAIQYQLKDPKSIKKQYNNIYVKNFDPSWDEAKLREVFGKFGNIHSVMMKNDINNVERKFAFICFHDPENKDHGFQAADRAVQELNDPNPNGLYVQPALTSIERQGVIRREQQRFKNSKKKCNLFVKNFPPEFTDENLRQLFGDHGEIESVKILPTHEGQPSCRAFVCFKQPDSAALARSKLHQQIFQGKQLYVTNYELPEIRKKQQAEAKDKADFYNQRKQFATNTIDASLLQKPDTIQLIQQILVLFQKQLGGRMPFQQNNNNYGNRPQNNYNNNGGPNGGGYQNNRNGPRQNGPNPNYQNRGQQQQQQYNGPPRQGGYPVQPQLQNIPQQPILGQPAGQQVVIVTPNIQGMPQAPLANPDPVVANYNQRGYGYLPAVVPENPNYKVLVGEFIYEFVQKLVGEQRAPKITGMLIDLPIEEIKAYLYDFSKLYQKIGEAIALLSQLQAQAQ